MRILVIGAGAVGGYYGARLHAAGRDVTFLVRGARAEALRRDGLRLASPHGDLTIAPKLLLAAEICEPFDLILLSTKAYSLQAAVEDFASAVGPETVILPLLNGLKHLELLAERFGGNAVLGGTTRIVADVDSEGRIVQMMPLQDLAFGELDKSVTPRIQAVARELTGAGFEAALASDILAAMWLKWTFLASLGAITCMMRGSVGAVASAPGGVETAGAIFNECAAIAAANGYPLSPALDAATRARVVDPASPLTASMYRDMLKGQPVEADHILGDMLARGQAHGVEAPLLRAAYVCLSVYAMGWQAG